jgi:phosphoribosylformylglycinamidine synthase subunit PurQ / glutaminase
MPGMTRKVGVITFPGSLDDVDAARAVRQAGGIAIPLWHAERDLHGVDAVILPGGFSYGDYLRCGAMASLSPVMGAVRAAADRGVAVAGICNGFQILCEAQMLPGALLRNAGLKYVCKSVELEVVNGQTRFTAGYQGRRDVTLTVGNGEGNFFADETTLDRLEGDGLVVFRYRDNPNGSARDIAGIINPRGNVLGLMPHPENHVEAALGPTDGRGLFAGLVDHFKQAA